MNVIAPSFNLLPVAAGFIRLKKLDGPARVLLLYLCINCLVSAASSLLAFYHKPNTPLFHFSVIVETLLLLYFFRKLFRAPALLKLYAVLLLAFPVFCLVNILFLQPLSVFNSYTLSVQAVLVIASCFLFWWNVPVPENSSWQAFPLNWMVSGLMLYFSSGFLLFTFINLVVKYLTKPDFILIWNIHATLSVIMYLLLTIGYFKYKS